MFVIEEQLCKRVFAIGQELKTFAKKNPSPFDRLRVNITCRESKIAVQFSELVKKAIMAISVRTNIIKLKLLKRTRVFAYYEATITRALVAVS